MHKSTAFFINKRTLTFRINPNITKFKTSGFTLVEFILKDELLISENFYLNKKETSLSLVSILQRKIYLYTCQLSLNSSCVFKASIVGIPPWAPNFWTDKEPAIEAN